MKKTRNKIYIYTLLLVLAILVVVWLLQVTFLETFYRHYKVRDIKEIQAEMVEQFNRMPVEEAYRSVWEIAETNEMYVAIYNERKQAVITPWMFMQKNDKTDWRFNAAMFNNYNKILDNAVHKMNETGQTTYVHYGNKMQEIVVVSEIAAADGTYYILTRAPLVPVKATTSILKRNYVMILTIGFMFACIVGFVLSAHISRPIRDLSKGAKAVAGGNLSYVVPDHRHNQSEMSQLIQDFNHMTEELSKVDSLRKDFVANVSHELRTPLTMIKGYAETIRDVTGEVAEKRNRQLDIIVEETDRLSDLIQDLLELSLMQANQVVFKSEQIDFSKTVNRVAERYACFKDRGYSISLSAEEGVFVTGDESRLEQVLYNLTDNAINHSGDERKISIRLTGGANARFSITNSGDTISEEDLQYIWERFYHVDKSGKRRVTGTGIGLSLVREILEKHGFAYGVQSAGNSTEFWFDLHRTARQES